MVAVLQYPYPVYERRVVRQQLVTRVLDALLLCPHLHTGEGRLLALCNVTLGHLAKALLQGVQGEGDAAKGVARAAESFPGCPYLKC